MQSTLPKFPGFYNSTLDSYFDFEIENEMEEKDEDYETVEKRIDYARGRLEMSQTYLKEFNKETKLNLKFLKLWSPREYNFMTDHIECEIPDEEWAAIWKEVSKEKEVLARLVKEKCTSYDGFVSFYSSSVTDWLKKETEEFEMPEAQIILEAYCEIRGFEIDELDENDRVRESAQAIWI